MTDSLWALFRKNKLAIIFIAKFVGLYFLLNSIYGVYINTFSPGPDLITQFVSENVRFLLSLIHSGIDEYITIDSPYIGILLNGLTVVNLFEGCNGVNVLIVFFSFVVAIDSKWYHKWIPLTVSLVILYSLNLARVCVLFWVALYYPQSLYFFHKFLFTGIIYAGVFLMWYLWLKTLRQSESRTSNA